MTAPINWCVSLGDEIVLFAIAGEIFDLIGHAPVMNLAVRRFDKSKLVDSRKGRHRADQTDVRAFWRFNWANASVMRWMNVAYFKSGTVPTKAPWSESGQTAFVGEFGQRIGLIHELGKLRSAEEIANDRAQRLWIDQFLRRHAVDIDVEQGHALLDQTLGASKANPALVSQKFAYSP